MNVLNKLSTVVGVALLAIIGCGGGGIDENPPPPAQYDISVLGPENDIAAVGESVGLVLMVPESNISDISWQQTSGPSVEFLAGNSKVIGFDVPADGTYNFSINFRDSAGGARSASYSFTATDQGAVYLNARVDFEVNSTAKASVYAFEDFPGTLNSLTWSQTQGPTVSTDSVGNGISFSAPNVSQDTVLTFRVDASDDQGNQASETVNVLVEPQSIDPARIFNSGRFENVAFADVYAYESDSPYADVIVECVYGNVMDDYCNFGTLPAMGMVNPSPTLDEVMDRVVVSHDWMGQKFRTFLQQMDSNNDIKNLLGAATAVVISYDVRPSFFWSGTGAIYIDPYYFWESPFERDTINKAPDFRSNFDEDLIFRDPWRVVLNNDYAWVSYSNDSRATRSFDEYRLLTARLLIHELAHANDFLPPRVWNSLSNSDLAWTYSSENSADSTGLDNTFPLSSQEMYGLGSVMFQGATATSTQQAYSPAQVSDFFFPDDANNTYNYSTEREDYAMLAEEYLMSYRYNVSYDAAITGLAPDYIIATGERGRVGHDRIKPRAEYVISRILPSIDLQAASASLPAPVQLESGVSWFASLVPPTANNAEAKSQSRKTIDRMSHPIQFSDRFHQSTIDSHEKNAEH